MQIKVCGMRNAENIAEVESLGIDMMGFIFWKKSKRYVEKLPEHMPGEAVKRIGVLVDAPITEVTRIAKEAKLCGVQLHGNETADYCRQLRQNSEMQGVKIIKAIGISDNMPFPDTTTYQSICDMLLFDTKSPLHGGTGKHFDWQKLDEYKGDLPFILSGGISPDDVEDLKAIRHSKMIGIDLNSKFEISPALKNVKLLKDFINKLKSNKQ